MIRKLQNVFVGLVLASAVTFVNAADEEFDEIPDAIAVTPESTDPIKLPLWEWTGHHVSQMLAGEILKTMGYNVEYVHVGGSRRYPRSEAASSPAPSSTGSVPIG